MPNVVQKASIHRTAVSDRQAAALTPAAGTRSESCPVPSVCVGLTWHSFHASVH